MDGGHPKSRSFEAGEQDATTPRQHERVREVAELEQMRYALDQAAIVAARIIAASSPTPTTNFARSRNTRVTS